MEEYLKEWDELSEEYRNLEVNVAYSLSNLRNSSIIFYILIVDGEPKLLGTSRWIRGIADKMQKRY